MNRFVCFIAAAGLAPGALAADIDVSGASALSAAIDGAAPGDRLLLSPGEYGAATIAGKSFSPAIILEASDPLDPPVFSKLILRDATGVHFRSIIVSYGATNAPLTSYSVHILRGRDIQISRSDIYGAPDTDATNDAYGVYIRDSSGVTLDENEIHDAFRGVAIFDSDQTDIRRNHFHHIGSDGIVGRGANGVNISDNLFTNFHSYNPLLYHPDAVQFWDTHAVRENRDLVIRGNLILRGAGDPAQGIFIRTPAIQTLGLTIEENIIHQSMGQGVYVENAADVSIRANTISPFDFTSDKPGLEIRNPGANVSLTDNIYAALRTTGAVAQSGNALIDFDNPWISTYAEKLLNAPLEGAGAAPSHFTPLTSAGARDYVTDIGAFSSGAALIDHSFSALNEIETTAGAGAIWRFREPVAAQFGDAVSGATGAWAFASSGIGEVLAELPPLGAENDARKKIRVHPGTVADLMFDGALADGAPEPVVFSGGPASYGGAAPDAYGSFNGLKANSGGAYLVSDRSPAFSGAEKLEISVRLRRPSPGGGWQILMTTPKVYDVRINGDRLRLSVWNGAGAVTRVDAFNSGLSDGAWHDLLLVYDGDAGEVKILVDGVQKGAKAAPGGALAYLPTQRLYVGGAPWLYTFSGDIVRVKIDRE